MDNEQGQKRVRGRGRGGSFFALDRQLWAELWSAETSNRIAFVTSYLVLLAGTGSDHRLTKWSAKAIEEYTGLGKPRGKRAIEELIAAKLLKRTETSTRLSPQYELPALELDADPIFLPMQIITGFGHETPILRRLREAGDPLALRMLIDLYGLIEVDVTYGVPIANMRECTAAGEVSARKVCESGVHAVWALSQGKMRAGAGDWTLHHRVKGATSEAMWAPFWERFELLRKIGAVWFEPWVYDGEELISEPLFPVDPALLYQYDPGDDEAKLTRLALDAARELVGERDYILDRHEFDILVPFNIHNRQPALRGVLKMRVEPDTPGRRMAFRSRSTAVAQYSRAFARLIQDVRAGHFDRPMQISKFSEAV
ncbi:hypothetical protein [Sphingomonas sp.]|uniref:hypothetical protein n=1 Tax=Sphingomonas sp. TaxID=28214 RepID=UPI003F6E65DA